MKTPAYLLLGLLAASALAACSKKEDATSPTSGDFMDFTYNGKAYHSVLYASAIEDSDTSLVFSGSSDDLNTVVTMKVPRIYKQGAKVYSFSKTSAIPLDPLPVAALTLDGKTSNGKQYSTLNGPSATNGSIAIGSYDRAGQKVAGTFSFTAGPVYGGAGSTQAVTGGKFSFTVFH